MLALKQDAQRNVTQLPAPIEESPDMTYPACANAVKTAAAKMPSLVRGATRPFKPMRTAAEINIGDIVDMQAMAKDTTDMHVSV